MSYSVDLFARAQKVIPGGVNSPVRAFGGVGGTPPFIVRGEDAYIIDVDGNRYIDFVNSWGNLIAGHAHPEINAALEQALKNGTSFGAPTELEIKLAEKISACMPAIEMLRMVSSGTEAAMSAIRLARGYTKRDKIIKFIGCYHGHYDALLVKAGSGNLTFGVPDSAGVPESISQHTLLAEYNDLAQVEKLFELHGKNIAAIIVEPVAANMNCVLPKAEFLAGLRKLCDHYQSVLIFDEVITGFRVGLGGAQGYFKVTPDLTILGKIIGGGLPVGAFGGKREIMQCLSPLGPVYQAGTLSGNPLAMTAGLVNLEIISRKNFYVDLEKTTQQLVNGIVELAQAAKIPLQCPAIGGLFGLHFNAAPAVYSYREVKLCNVAQFKQFFHAALSNGIYFAPSAFEAAFVSSAHGITEINQTLTAIEKIFRELKSL